MREIKVEKNDLKEQKDAVEDLKVPLVSIESLSTNDSP